MPQVKDVINDIVDFLVNDKFVVFVLVAEACLAGSRSMRTLTLDVTPDVSGTQVMVHSRWDLSPDMI